MSNPVPAADESAPKIDIPRILALPMSVVLKDERETYERSTKIPWWWGNHVQNHLFGHGTNTPRPHSFIMVGAYTMALLVAHHFYPLRTERLAFIHVIISFIVTFLFLDGQGEKPIATAFGWMIKRILFIPSALYLSAKEFFAWILWRRGGEIWDADKAPWDAKKTIASLMRGIQLRMEVTNRHYRVIRPVIDSYKTNIEAIEASAVIAEKEASIAQQKGQLLTAANYEEMATEQRAQVAKLRYYIENQKAYTDYLDTCSEQFRTLAEQYTKLQLEHIGMACGSFSENDLLTLEENMDPLRNKLQRDYVHIMTTLHDAQRNKPAPTLGEKAGGKSASASTN